MIQIHFNVASAAAAAVATSKVEKTVKSTPAAIMPAPPNPPEPVPPPETNIFPDANTGSVRYTEKLWISSK